VHYDLDFIGVMALRLLNAEMAPITVSTTIIPTKPKSTHMIARAALH